MYNIVLMNKKKNKQLCFQQQTDKNLIILNAKINTHNRKYKLSLRKINKDIYILLQREI